MLTFTHTRPHSKAACCHVWHPRDIREGPLCLSEPQVCALIQAWDRVGSRALHTLGLRLFSAWDRSLRTNAEPVKLNYTQSPNGSR